MTAIVSLVTNSPLAHLLPRAGMCASPFQLFFAAQEITPTSILKTITILLFLMMLQVDGAQLISSLAGFVVTVRWWMMLVHPGRLGSAGHAHSWPSLQGSPLHSGRALKGTRNF